MIHIFLFQKNMDHWFNLNVINAEHYFGVLSGEKHILTLKESWDSFNRYFNQFNNDDPRPLKKEFKKYMENKIGMKVIVSSTGRVKWSNDKWKTYRNFWCGYDIQSMYEN